jgi:glyoxylase I family protein
MAQAGAGVKTGHPHHIRMTVTDPARSLAFYSLLGFNVLRELPDGLIVSNGSVMLGLRAAPDASKAIPGDRFDPNRVGLDHLSLSAGSRADLETVIGVCKAQGVECGEIFDFGPELRFYVLMLKDPDGIQIELAAFYD